MQVSIFKGFLLNEGGCDVREGEKWAANYWIHNYYWFNSPPAHPWPSDVPFFPTPPMRTHDEQGNDVARNNGDDGQRMHFESVQENEEAEQVQVEGKWIVCCYWM